MSRAIELLTLLQQIRGVADQAADVTLDATAVAASARPTLGVISDLAGKAIKLITVGDAPVASVEPRSQSSVEIKESAKGEPTCTVKVYEGSDINGPAAVAVAKYLEVKRLLAPQTDGVS